MGTVIAVGLPVGWWALEGSGAPGAVRPGTAAALASRSVGRVDPEPAGNTGSRTPATSPVSISASGGQVGTPAPAAVPTRLTITSISVNATVVPVGVSANGEVAIPDDITTVGWYRWAAAPNDTTGSVVIVGHVDSARQGRGALFRLATLAAGSVVSLTTATGNYQYQVVSRQEFLKTTVPWAALFSTGGTPRLTLITCGGAFDRTTLSYLDNVVVTAVPL